MRCTATNRKNGRQCKKHAMHGFDLCMTHNPAAEESRNRAKSKLVPGGPKNEPLATPEITAVLDEEAAIVTSLRPIFKDAEGHVLPENLDLVGVYAEAKLDVKELRKTKPMTQAKRRELDAAIKRRDAYRDALGLGGPGTREKFDSLEAQQIAERTKQGKTPLESEERAEKVAELLAYSGGINQEQMNRAHAAEAEGLKFVTDTRDYEPEPEKGQNDDE